MPEVLVGMSGGVDSSAAAVILKRKGYDVVGCTMSLLGDINTLSSDADDARNVCEKIGIKHIILDFSDKFRAKVIDSFISSYFSGETPNPCIECNKYLKFGLMLESAKEMGIDYIATGHYAFTDISESGRYLLKRPSDVRKDQTYVLYHLTQYQLSHTLFPLADYSKAEIREIAGSEGLVNSHKPDSQDICFVPDGDYAGFIERLTGKVSTEGDFIDTEKRILGKHRGIIHYTTGQRKGLGMSFGKPMFVVGKDISSNSVILGEEKELYTSELLAKDVNFIPFDRLDGKMRVSAKTRYSQKEQPAEIEMSGELLKVKFDEPQRAITSGQAVVLYDNDIVVGGGKII